MESCKKELIDKLQNQKKAHPKIFRIIFCAETYDFEKEKEKMFSPILKIIPLSGKKYLIEKFNPEISSGKNITILHVTTYEKFIIEVIRNLDKIKNKLIFRIDFPIRFYYKNKFVRIIYPCVLFAGIINYFTKYIDTKILDSNIIKEFIKESKYYVKPILLNGKIVKYKGKEYVVGNYRFLVDTNWKYYYLALFVETLAKEMLTLPNHIKKELKVIKSKEK